MIAHTCDFCGKAFSAKKNARRFCSRVCNSKAIHAKHAVPKECEHCGKAFDGMPIKRFCSAKCREAARWIRRNKKSSKPLKTPTYGFWGI